MRWLVGWSSPAGGHLDGGAENAVHPVGAQLLWQDPDPLWAVGDWRPDEVRVVQADPATRLAVLGCCGATDGELRAALLSARGGAFRHLTTWPGSYTAVAQIGRRLTVIGDLAGTLPVFHTPWQRGTAFATAALPLADLVEAPLDVTHLAALLACPDTPEALGDGTPYSGVRRVPPGHALILREGALETVGYEPTASLAVAAAQMDAEQALEGIRESLVNAVRTRLAAPRHAPGAETDQGPVPGMGPADRRAARGAPAPGIGADLSGGSASATLALLAAGLPGAPGTLFGHGTGGGERLLAVTFNDLTAGPAREAELERARALAADPRLHHVVVAAGEEVLPYSGLDTVFLTDEPGPALVSVARDRRRLLAGGADHLVGHGARQVLDAHPARLADLLLVRQRRRLIRPMTALAKSAGPSGPSFLAPFTVYRAARRLARTSYREGIQEAAGRLLQHRAAGNGTTPNGGAVDASLAALAWCRPGPAARWLTGEALAEVSARLQESAARPATAERPGERRAGAVLARAAADHRVFQQASEIRGQRLHAPFFDNQVVRACRALPESVRVRPGARPSVLRGVLAGSGIHELPAGWGATSQDAQAAAARTGLRSAVDDLVRLFETPLLADAGLVDARVVRRALRSAAEGRAVPLDGLAELVSTELWLRRLLARRGSCWTGAAARQRAVAEGVPRSLSR
ncbi:asparagine synthase-related protein [Streptomyces sp. TP-A0874]|uniref:asparagine synthase-related protein n=1 Tax=Streptomyces sp. TP-A0874 TaxID=549819 RepID=UPI0009A068C6|nr:asparagine synthase-related protein [Streptomyces sp. TP-A0874]